MFDDGRGVAKDETEALKWYRKAADQGFVQAQIDLGGHYARGAGVPRNLARACYWLSLARPDTSKVDVARDLTCAQLDSAQRHAVKIEVKKAEMAEMGSE